MASFNVHSWVGRDRRADPGRCVAVLREIDADVVALQEVRTLPLEPAGHLEAIFAEEGYELLVGPTLTHGDAAYGNALLSRVPTGDVSRLELPAAGREPRGALAATAQAQGRRVRIIATHLGLRAPERAAQVARLLDWIADEAVHPRSDALCLLGDFNEWRRAAPALARLERAFGAVAAPRTFPSFRPWLRLDRIWAMPAAALAGGVAVHRSPAARVASDHLPVVAAEVQRFCHRARQDAALPARLLRPVLYHVARHFPEWGRHFPRAPQKLRDLASVE